MLYNIIKTADLIDELESSSSTINEAMHSFFTKQQIANCPEEFFWIILTMLVLIIVFNLFLYLISLIGKLFIKTTYIINEDKLIVNGKIKKNIDLSQVEAITYDLGGLSKYGRNPSKLVIFDKDFKAQKEYGVKAEFNY